MNYDAGSPLNLSQNANCIDNCDFGFSSSSKWRKSQTRDAFKGEEKLEKNITIFFNVFYGDIFIHCMREILEINLI